MAWGLNSNCRPQRKEFEICYNIKHIQDLEMHCGQQSVKNYRSVQCIENGIEGFKYVELIKKNRCQE